MSGSTPSLVHVYRLNRRAVHWVGRQLVQLVQAHDAPRHEVGRDAQHDDVSECADRGKEVPGEREREDHDARLVPGPQTAEAAQVLTYHLVVVHHHQNGDDRQQIEQDGVADVPPALLGLFPQRADHEEEAGEGGKQHHEERAGLADLRVLTLHLGPCMSEAGGHERADERKAADGQALCQERRYESDEDGAHFRPQPFLDLEPGRDDQERGSQEETSDQCAHAGLLVPKPGVGGVESDEFRVG